MPQTKMYAIICVLTLLSGLADARGFVHAARLWQGSTFVWPEACKSGLGFAIGITCYWLSLRWLKQAGVVTPELQTVVWFAVTIIGVAFASGRFLRWHLLDQVIAAIVLSGMGWLLFRTSTEGAEPFVP